MSETVKQDLMPWPETLRDYFAAAALTGLLAKATSDYDWRGVAEDSYLAADCMLAARELKPDGEQGEAA